MPTIYVRVSESAYRFAKDEADRTGLSLAKVVETYLGEIERRGLRIAGRKIEEPGTAPAGSGRSL